MIELKKVNKVYDNGFQALTDIDVEFADGKINVLIGPSGCGKTTTMKLLNRLVDYTDGEVIYNGQEIKDMNPIELRREMGFVIQNIGLFPHMTIFNNVATVPRLLKWDKERTRKRVIELLEMVNLDPDIYMERYPHELSGGQQQRIGVIRALAAEPTTILMDEPFSALDPISREQLQDELIRLQTEINKTIVFVTHDMDEALKIADHIILMKDGEIVQQGSPEEIISNPVNDFVKEFIGEERLLINLALSPMRLEDFIITDVPKVKRDILAKEAMKQFLKAEVAEIVVVNHENIYEGILSLYTTMENQDKVVKELTHTQSVVINENESVEAVLDKLENIKQTIPVIGEDQKLVGILDTNKLFSILQHMTENKHGDE